MFLKDFTINFDITNYCNSKCPTCAREKKLSGYFEQNGLNNYHADVHLFEKTILENNKIGLKNCVCKFCGEIGDPIVHPQLEEFLKISSENFKEVAIYTNGGARNSEWIKKMMKNFENIVFVFAIDGLSQEINNLYRTGVDFNLAFSNMLAACEIDSHRVCWHFTIFPWNMHQVEEVKKISKKYDMPLDIRNNNHIDKLELRVHNKIFKKWENDKRKM